VFTALLTYTSQFPMQRPTVPQRRPYQRIATPPTLPGGSVRAPAAVALDRQQINRWLAQDPLFNVWTVDQNGWIDPFTGAVIKSTKNAIKLAKRHLLQNRPWMKFGLRTMPELQVIRWTHHLQRWVEPDGRLRIFRRDGLWLNPYSGEWEKSVPLENGKVTYATVEAMARVLAAKPLPQPSEPLDTAEIGKRIYATTVAANPPTPPASGSSPSARLRALPLKPPPGKLPDQESFSAEAQLGVEAPAARNTDLDRAKQVLEKMLPQIPDVPGWDIGLCWEPQSIIGGDFYDLIRVDPRHLFFAIGDVSGHGTSAALVVASTLKSLRHAVKAGGNLTDIVVRFNDDIVEDLLASYFITMFAGLIDLETKTLTCICAGHHPALLGNTKRRAVLTQIGTAAPAIGLMKGDILVTHLEPMTLQLRTGDVILQFTDGLFETTNQEREPYGRRRVMANFLLELDKNAEVMSRNLVADSRKYTAEHFADDVSVLAIKVMER
jgi:serine phosphatase RsbU (regulator of sigma subunit)